ncbi:hypothetical protein Lepil_1132 [Leptonema illini DSM 21528]|uniref:Uncharacterized protein n=1 Tax=Leptonema illini DSM 21528 TaxID=929563 RepID=H2CGY5_9LEPT|nr:hypothetical protein Lepil_1132 [Leptonema illini DSM 21528]
MVQKLLHNKFVLTFFSNASLIVSQMYRDFEHPLPYLGTPSDLVVPTLRGKGS